MKLKRRMRELAFFLLTTWAGYMLQGYELAAAMIFLAAAIYAFDLAGWWKRDDAWPNHDLAPIVAIIVLLLGYGVAQWTRSFADVGAVPQTDITHFEDIAKRAGEEAAKKYMDDKLRSPSARDLLSTFLARLLRQLEPALPSQMEKALEENIGLFEYYAKYEWSLTGYTILEPFPLSGRTLKAEFKQGQDYRLTPLIRNDNGVPLYEPRITVRVPMDVLVQKTKLWAPTLTDRHLAFHAEGFGPVVKGQYRGLNESLFLRFPHAGKYPIDYTIHGIADGITVTVEGQFVLEVL